jgi:phage minor structural protein
MRKKQHNELHGLRFCDGFLQRKGGVAVNLPRLLDSNLHEVRRLHPIKLSITENIVPLSTAQMGLIVSETVPDRAYVELFNVNGSCGIYRTKAPQIGYGDAYYTVDLEHAVCEVGDWVITADAEQAEKTLSQALTQVFGYYRGSKWQLGTVSVSANVIFSLKYGDNILTTMNNLIKNVPSAMMSFNFSTSPWTVNVVARGTTVSAEGRLSRNVKTAVVTKDVSSLCTRVYVKGLGQDGAIGYLDADTVSTYGVVEKYLSGDYTAAQAAVVAAQYLALYKRPKFSVSLGLLDLHSITGEELDKIQIGKLYRLALPEENTTIEENIISISWADVINSQNVASVTLSQEEGTLITFMQQSKEETKQDIEDSYYECYSESKSYTNSAIRGEAERSDDKYIYKTSVYQTADSIATAAEQYADGHCIAKTSIYQDAASIVAAAEGYTDGKTTKAAILLAINDGVSMAKISADQVDLQGHVSITDLEEWGNSPYTGAQLTVTGSIQATGTLVGNSLSIADGNFEVNGTYFTVETVTLNGSQCKLLVGF